MVNDLEFFKIRNKAIAPFVYSRIVSLQAFLSSGRRNPPISNEIEQTLEETNYEKGQFISLFSKAFASAYEKCEKHILSIQLYHYSKQYNALIQDLFNLT